MENIEESLQNISFVLFRIILSINILKMKNIIKKLQIKLVSPNRLFK